MIKRATLRRALCGALIVLAGDHAWAAERSEENDKLEAAFAECLERLKGPQPPIVIDVFRSCMEEKLNKKEDLQQRIEPEKRLEEERRPPAETQGR